MSGDVKFVTSTRTKNHKQPTMQKITPFLWFNDNAEEAMNFYTTIFKDSKIGKVSRYGDTGPGPKGSVMTAEFTLNGHDFLALNGGPSFKFTEAISFVVNCETQKEVDYYWDKLLQGGNPQQCGWLKDKFGLSWQIVPVQLGQLMTGPAEKTNRAMQAMMKMVKLDIKALQDAYDGK
jgi:predicted 3-demethylubiquinone-9 3-methyltransferase (glyoxalase superfamily)